MYINNYISFILKIMAFHLNNLNGQLYSIKWPTELQQAPVYVSTHSSFTFLQVTIWRQFVIPCPVLLSHRLVHINSIPPSDLSPLSFTDLHKHLTVRLMQVLFCLLAMSAVFIPIKQLSLHLLSSSSYHHCYGSKIPEFRRQEMYLHIIVSNTRFNSTGIGCYAVQHSVVSRKL